MFNPQGKPPAGPHVAQAVADQPDRLAEMEVGDDLGSFTGFLRRSKSSAAGLTAQIFGENGPDADLICSFHLTRFLDAPVHVTVWQVKDRDGHIMRVNGEYPKLVEFNALIRRPAASIHGQVALFFGANGTDADAINVLNQTRYLDALVHVQLRKADPGVAPSAVAQAPVNDLNEAAQRLTSAELKQLKEQQRRAKSAQELLHQGGFYRSAAVWNVLGSSYQFKDWIVQQPCCQPGKEPCDGAPIVAHAVPGGGGYHLVPLCRDHADIWQNGTPDLMGQNPLDFLHMRQTTLVQRWAKEQMRRALRVPEGFDPTPNAVYKWATEHKLLPLLPPGFAALL